MHNIGYVIEKFLIKTLRVIYIISFLKEKIVNIVFHNHYVIIIQISMLKIFIFFFKDVLPVKRLEIKKNIGFSKNDRIYSNGNNQQVNKPKKQQIP